MYTKLVDNMKTFAEIEGKLRYTAEGIIMPDGVPCKYSGIFLSSTEFPDEPFDQLTRITTSELGHKEFLYAQTFTDQSGTLWAQWIRPGHRTDGTRTPKQKSWEDRVLGL